MPFEIPASKHSLPPIGLLANDSIGCGTTVVPAPHHRGSPGRLSLLRDRFTADGPKCVPKTSIFDQNYGFSTPGKTFRARKVFYRSGKRPAELGKSFSAPEKGPPSSESVFLLWEKRRRAGKSFSTLEKGSLSSESVLPVWEKVRRPRKEFFYSGKMAAELGKYFPALGKASPDDRSKRRLNQRHSPINHQRAGAVNPSSSHDAICPQGSVALPHDFARAFVGAPSPPARVPHRPHSFCVLPVSQ